MINLTNFENHPTRKTYTVFHFYHEERADYFEELLNNNNIWFEKETENQDDNELFYFGVKNTDLKEVKQYNYLVSAKHRKPIIPSKIGRWALYIFTLVLLTFIVIGYLKSKP